MIDSLVNLVFRCRHTRLTRPVTPVSRPGHPAEGNTYVVCLDCGKHFDYDPVEMRIGKPVAPRPSKPAPGGRHWKQVLLASLSFGVLLGSLFRRSRRKSLE
jgi:hypothetical protein